MNVVLLGRFCCALFPVLPVRPMAGLALSLLVVASASGQQNVTWQGSGKGRGTNGAWETAKNWSQGAIPLSLDNVMFSATNPNFKATKINGNRAINGISFGTSSHTLTLTGDIVLNVGTATVVKTGITETLAGSGMLKTKDLHLEALSFFKIGVGPANRLHAVTGIVSGSGTVNGDLEIGGTGTHSVGGSLSMNGTAFERAVGANAALQAVTGKLTYATGSVFEWNLMNYSTTGRGVNFDAVNVGSLAGSGAIFKIVLGSDIDYQDSFWDQNQTWSNVFEGGSTDMASVFHGTQSSGSAGRGSFTVVGNDLQWTSEVPEPSTALGGLLIAAGLARRSRRPFLA